MSRSYSRSFFIRLFVLVVSIAFFGDLYVSAQNTNSSTTTDDNMSMQNTNSSTTYPNRRRRRRRRGRRYPAATPTMTPACGPMDPGMPVATTPVRYGRCDPNVQEQTDLSGAYTGTVNYSEGGLSGDATLTITGNDFTMTAGSTTQEGKVAAVTTCNYTAVTMMFGKQQLTATSGAQPAALPAVSLRAKKTGKWLTLTTVPGEKREFSFTSRGGTTYGRRPRGRRARRGYRVAIKPPTAAMNTQNATAP